MPKTRPIAEWTRLVSIPLIVIGLVVLAGALPLEQGIRAVVGWVEGLGPAGPLVYAGIYVLVTVLMIPAAAFSIVAGALFGLFWGTVAVWLGSNLGAAAAFLIARYLARDAVAKKLAGFPKFEAIDRAVAQGGWKIVAMLRLSPAVPFNVQNYVYGLTGIRFWACVGATAVAMLPGIFLYVYLGYAGRASIEAAAAGEVQRGWEQWLLLVLGLIATVAVTVYITKLARRAIAAQIDVEPAEDSQEKEQTTTEKQPADNGTPWIGAAVSAVVALLVLIAAALAVFQPEFITRLFGPPAVTMAEAYEERPEGPAVDHSRLQNVLDAFLDQIEHVQIREHFIEPDYHFAAVCAAIGCPPLRTEVYPGEWLDAQLRDQARIVHQDGTRWFQYDRENGVLHLTPLYQWYRGDFEQVKSDIFEDAAQYNDTLAADLEAGIRPSERWLEYDWALNDQEALQ